MPAVKEVYKIRVPLLDPLHIEIIIQHRDGVAEAYRYWVLEPPRGIELGPRFMASTEYVYLDGEDNERVRYHDMPIAVPPPDEVARMLGMENYRVPEGFHYTTTIELGDERKTDGYVEISFSESMIHPRVLHKVVLAEKIDYQEAMRFVMYARTFGWFVVHWRVPRGEADVKSEG